MNKPTARIDPSDPETVLMDIRPMRDLNQWTCPRCKEETFDGLKYCRNCGHRRGERVGLK